MLFQAVWRYALMLACVMATSVMSTSVMADETATFKIATLTPDGSAWMKHMRAGGEKIEQRTEGRVKFKFYPGGVMGDDKAVLRKIRIGQLQGGALTAGGLADIYPDGQIYTLPLAFRSFDEVEFVRQQLDPLLIKGYEESGLVTFGFAGGGFAYPMTGAEPVLSPDDFSKRKVWIPSDDNMSQRVMDLIHVTPVPLGLGDVLVSLQTGIVDTIAAPPGSALVMQWHTQVTSLTPIPVSYIYGLFFIDKKAFSRLSMPDQEIVRDEMTKVFIELDALNRQDDANALSALQQQGISIEALSEADRAAWNALSTQVQDVFTAQRIFSPEMYGRFRSILATYREKNTAAVAP